MNNHTIEKKISVVIPTCRENDDSYLLQMAQRYPSHPAIEYWVIDTETPSKLFERINRKDFNILQTDAVNRAARLNLGFEKAMGGIVIFHHPRSLLDTRAFWFLYAHSSQLNWGGFTHSFGQDHWGLKWTSFYSNRVRPKLFKILYLDHCIFFKKELLTRKVPNIPIFEDTEISKILMKSGTPTILPFESMTSPIRFKKNGFLKQALMNQALKVGYHFGTSRKKMNDLYEKNLNLNG